MRLVPKVMLFALVLLLAGVSAGWSADMCFRTFVGADPADLFVGKGFALPAAGACREFSGFFANTSEPIWGNACGTSDNATIRFNLQYSKFRESGAAPFVYYALAQMVRSTGQGQVEYLFDNSGSTSGVFDFRKVACPTLAGRPLN